MEEEKGILGEVKSTAEMKRVLNTLPHAKEMRGVNRALGILGILMVFSIPLILWMRKEGFW